MSSGASKHFAINCVEEVEVRDGDVNSVFSTPVALSYDHILEQIFESLGSTDLLNCRLVSHRWLFFAQNPLQKKICLYFYNNEQCRNCVNSDEPSSKHLTKLTEFLKKRQSPPDCEVTGGIPIIFPSNSFFLQHTSLSNDDVHQFLNTNGPNIRQLYLIPTFDDTPNENYLMDQVAHLLLHQAPNLQTLFLAAKPTVSWKTENLDRSQESELQQTDPEYEEICQKAKDLLQSVNGSSLKLLHLLGEGMAKLLEFVIRISPKLEEIMLNREYYKYLIVPENRLWLLKSLKFDLDPEDNASVEEMETISCGKFKLRKIEVNFDHVIKCIEKHPDFQPKISQMLNRMFHGSRDTIEHIDLHEFTFLRGMVMPEVMPKVKQIQIVNSQSTETDVNSNATVFPFGFHLQKCFPKLRHVRLANYVDEELGDTVTCFSRFLNCLNFGADPCEPLSTSVKRVTLSARFCRNQKELLSPLISQRILRWFPNAVVEIGRI